MKRKIAYMVFIILILLTACNIFPLDPGPWSFHDADIDNPEEYAVINAVIDSLFGDSELVHVMQTLLTVSDSTMSYVDFYLEQADINDSLMRANYLANNDSTHHLDPDKLDNPAEALSLTQFAYYFISSGSDMGFTGYYNDYPESSGILHLHRPGFNADSTMAMFELGFMRGELGGYGSLVISEKINGIWVLTHQYQIFSN